MEFQFFSCHHVRLIRIRFSLHMDYIYFYGAIVSSVKMSFILLHSIIMSTNSKSIYYYWMVTQSCFDTSEFRFSEKLRPLHGSLFCHKCIHLIYTYIWKIIRALPRLTHHLFTTFVLTCCITSCEEATEIFPNAEYPVHSGNHFPIPAAMKQIQQQCVKRDFMESLRNWLENSSINKTLYFLVEHKICDKSYHMQFTHPVNATGNLSWSLCWQHI